MKFIITTLFILNYTFGFAQIKSVVINSASNSPIPYVNIWVENENIGTTSNEKGVFSLNEVKPNSNKNLILSALGFKTKTINISNIKDSIFLNPKITTLDEVVLINKREDKKLIIGKFKKSKINYYYGSGNKPWMIARYFPFEERFKDTPYLKTLKIHTNSKIDNAKFNIRIYKKGVDIKLQEVLHKANIIATAKKGNKVTEINLSDYNIIIPKEGVFVVVEWLIIAANKRVFTTTMKNKEIDMLTYEPKIGTLPVENNKNSWIYRNGKWTKPNKVSEKSKLKKYKNKYNLLAMELTLTN